MQRTEIEPLLAALRSHHFVLRPAPPYFIERTRVVPLVHATGIQTDLVLGGPGLEELFLERAVERDVAQCGSGPWGFPTGPCDGMCSGDGPSSS
jgi:hypothetical protein